MAQNKKTNKHNQEFDFFEKVQINDDQDNWGHGIRQEIIGKRGVIFGIARRQGETKYYVYVNDLDQTHGIADINLESLNRFETMHELIPEFCSHFIMFFLYCMGYDGMAEKPNFFPTFEQEMAKIEGDYPPKAIELCLEYAIKNLEKVKRPPFFMNEYPDGLVHEYLKWYQDSFLRKTRNTSS